MRVLIPQHVGLERALFCLFDRPDSLQMADEYQKQARLLDEWEGFADSPLAEAATADAFWRRHRFAVGSVRAALSGHGTLCDVSGLDGLDRASDRRGRSCERRKANSPWARDANYSLIRIVAEHLLSSRKCFAW